MSTLYFGCCNECPNQQLNTTHDLTNTIKLCCFQEMKNCHHLRQSSIFEHLKIVFAQFHIQLGYALKIKLLKNWLLKGVYKKIMVSMKYLEINFSYNYP